MYGYVPDYDPRQNKDQMKLTAVATEVPQMTTATVHPSLGYSLDYLLESVRILLLKAANMFC